MLYREENNDQELELTTIELEEEQTWTTDKSETIENQLSKKLTSDEYKNEDFGCCTMDSNSPSIVNGRNLNFRDMEEMIAFWEELEMVENTTVVGSVWKQYKILPESFFLFIQLLDNQFYSCPRVK